MDLKSYAELAVSLVNSASDGARDPLRSTTALRTFLADQPFLAGPTTQHDLDALRPLRAELASLFAESVTGYDAEAINRLNALLVQYPVHPEIARHGTRGWHVHLAHAGSVADRYAAGAVVGLALAVSRWGLSRFGVCAVASCSRVFVDFSSAGTRRYCAEHAGSRSAVTPIGRPAQTRLSRASRAKHGRPAVPAQAKSASPAASSALIAAKCR